MQLTLNAMRKLQVWNQSLDIPSKGVNWENVQIFAFFALRSRPSTAFQSDCDHFCLKLKLAL